MLEGMSIEDMAEFIQPGIKQVMADNEELRRENERLKTQINDLKDIFARTLKLGEIR